ncbi:type I-E CRISPR-associated endonuclease Cas1e [Galbitalea sp. SE-J8]|uniref:type I-E CRISPR-associated endonuclease Cas1e n=1 Tax=Galbitalea sp. SE-J8 TaxID=3054952 RepID=UPI00259CF6F6|nr:type I-E CRISPR-associated endonuclease Cas1e [Galbitalea sp. SE-J8]MDM4762835.1 type I-E CRISPR-associated endonuclease Cas1e [Galbitalea sp. SE-J8]
MAKRPGPPPPELPELVRAEDRISFICLEHAVIHRDQNAITATDARGTVHIPAASLGALLLGPGTSVTHQAIVLLAESGSTAVWVGEQGVRYYAHGRSLARRSRLLDAQARLVSNQSSRLAVARAMYGMRFADEEVGTLTMQQLRGREGARVRAIYRNESRRTGVPWTGRTYDPDDFAGGDVINTALTSAHQCLYGVVHAVVVALGGTPGLGFVHTGHARSFVFDIADLYKAEITIPIAFDAVAAGPEDIESATRHAVRDAIVANGVLSRCSRDIRTLLLPTDETEANLLDNVVELWDGQGRHVASGRSYGTGE